MNNNPQNIYVFDVGSTLIEKPSNIMVSTLAEDLIALQKNGNCIGIATMRNLTMLKELVNQVKFDFIIALNGAYVQCGNEVIVDKPIESKDFIQIQKALDYKQVQYKLYTKNSILNQEESNEKVYGIELKECYDFVDELKASFPSFVFHIWEKGKSCDIHSIDVSKAKAIEKVCNYFGIPIQKSIAFGDGFNDIEMFKVCGKSIAMETAPDQLKQIATFVTKSVKDNGVSWALKQLQL
jgi:hydroxymethylpyrimidine pyrophosphatase-like HAD family hydrolase